MDSAGDRDGDWICDEYGDGSGYDNGDGRSGGSVDNGDGYVDVYGSAGVGDGAVDSDGDSSGGGGCCVW